MRFIQGKFNNKFQCGSLEGRDAGGGQETRNYQSMALYLEWWFSVLMDKSTK